MIVNAYDPGPTAPGLHIFFQLKRPSRKPLQIPCVFSSKTRPALNVVVNLHDSRPTATTVLVFFQRKRVLQESCRIPQVHFHCVFSGTMRVGFTSQCEFTCDAASPCRIRENAPRRNDEEVLKLEERDMLTKEFSHVCVAWKKSDAAASTCAKDPQAPKKSTSKRRYVVYICSGKAGGNERDLLFYVRYAETWLTCTSDNLTHVDT